MMNMAAIGGALRVPGKPVSLVAQKKMGVVSLGRHQMRFPHVRPSAVLLGPLGGSRSGFLSGSRVPVSSAAPVGMSSRSRARPLPRTVAAAQGSGSSDLESGKLPKELRDRTLSAIDKLGKRVTVGDVAAAAGVKIPEAERALTAIAADTAASLEVSDAGEVVYGFPRDIKGTLSSKSLAIRMEPVVKKAQLAAAYLVRVSFGTALIASAVVVYAAIFAIMTSSRSDRDDRDRGYGGGYGRGPMMFFSPMDLFWYFDPYYYQNRRVRRMQSGRQEEMNFLESVFSFVFGDGDPNEDFEERRWRAVGALIQRKGGVVTAEQLAPYLDPPPMGQGGMDESFVVPVLQRFDGSPEVDEDGNLLYRFPQLQVSGGGGVGGNWGGAGAKEGGIMERRWEFSEAGKSQLFLAAGLGLANLVGVVVLGNMLADPYTRRSLGYGVVKVAADLYPFLEAYAYSFFVIPLVRWLWNKRRNAAVADRNANRMRAQVMLERPDSQLSNKIASARQQSKREVVTQDRIVYRSDQAVEEQKYDEEEFERRLRELDNK